VPDTFVAFETS